MAREQVAYWAVGAGAGAVMALTYGLPWFWVGLFWAALMVWMSGRSSTGSPA